MMSTSDSVHGRNLRPLMPRPLFNNSFSSSIIGNNHFSSLQNPKWTHPTLCDYGGKRVGVAPPPLVSSRWNPTAEQVQALEEMYRRGTRTPSAEQIQQIAAKLRRFGKIEGKNVFYWFQNHKARDRQKKRRQLELLAAGKNTDNIPPRKQSGLCRKYMEMEQQPKMSKCSTGPKYDGGEVEECNKRERWTSSSAHKIIDEKSPAQENAFGLDLRSLLPSRNDNLETGVQENRTLELFPLMGSGTSTLSSTNEEMDDVSSAGHKFVPNQFFEFLPTKN